MVVQLVDKPPRDGGLDYTTCAYACVLCGVPDLRCLCRACRLAHTDAQGALHPAIAALRRDAQAHSMRVKRNGKRLRGAATKGDGAYPGLRFVSLDALGAAASR